MENAKIPVSKDEELAKKLIYANMMELDVINQSNGLSPADLAKRLEPIEKSRIEIAKELSEKKIKKEL